MVSRRLFIQAGTLAALPLAAGASLARDSQTPALTAAPPSPLYKVVFDERFSDSVVFGREATRLGLATTSIQGDITQLWYDDLYHRWRAGPVAIAGMTTTDALFCLETLGNDAGLRLAFRAEHRLGNAAVEHKLMGPQALLQHASLQSCGDQWSSHMAELVRACPATRAGRSQATATSARSHSGSVDQPLLVSWVLAPMPRRTSFFV